MFGNEKHRKSDNLTFRTSALSGEDLYLVIIIVKTLGDAAFDWSSD